MPSTPHRLSVDHLGRLLSILLDEGYQVLGPRVRDEGIDYGPVGHLSDLARGYRSTQTPGRYRLQPGREAAFFDFAAPIASPKRFFHVARQELWSLRRSASGEALASANRVPFEHHPGSLGGSSSQKLALIGVRSCDLQGLSVLDRVLSGGEKADPWYRARRETALLIAVNCTVPASTCFCHSQGTGPRASAPFDLALTEIVEGADQYFVAVAGSPRGEDLLEKLVVPPASLVDTQTETVALEACAAAQVRRLPEASRVREVALAPESPRFVEVAERCIACGNCTMVCPTCFCTRVDTTTSLNGDQATATRSWESCFTPSFSYVHGGVVRESLRSRYRQWLSHKFATWYDQFGSSGCVGCGRCITHCPVGIDVTEEVPGVLERPA